MTATLHHFSIFVSDMEKTIRLFRDILGFKLSWHVHKAKGHVLSSLLGIHGMEAELACLEDRSTMSIELARLIHPVIEEPPSKFGNPGTCSLSLRVDNLEDLYVRLGKEGWNPISPCLELKPPDAKTAKAFCVRIEPNLLLELIEY